MIKVYNTRVALRGESSHKLFHKLYRHFPIAMTVKLVGFLFAITLWGVDSFTGVRAGVSRVAGTKLFTPGQPQQRFRLEFAPSPERGSLSKTVDVASPMSVASAEMSVQSGADQTITSSSISSTGDGSQYELSPQQFVYVVLTSIFVTCLIIADVIGVKLFEIPLPFEILGHKTVEHTCGMLTFPVTFLLGDVINEYYGPKAAKRTVYIGLAMSILVFLVMNVAQAMPYLDKPFNVTKESFDMIFGSAKLMYVASICAYYVGSLSDIALFGIIKKATGGKLLWLRAAGSTVISQVLDSFVVSYLAFSLGKTLQGVPGASIPEVLEIAATGYGLKFFLSACMIPFLYVIKGVLTDQMG